MPSVSTASFSVEFSRSFQGPFLHRLSNFAQRLRQSLLLRPGSLLATSTQLTALTESLGTLHEQLRAPNPYLCRKNRLILEVVGPLYGTIY